MDRSALEKLLSLDEGSNLDFKREFDLESKRGKANFLVEVLGLANAPSKPSFLVIGIEDETRKVVGISEDLSEERIQKFLADNCRPPIDCKFKVIPYKRKRVGVLAIYGKRRPYTVRGDLGYQDENGKQHKISDKEIFVRRGSTGDTATPEEIREMALERQSNSDDIAGILDELTSDTHQINNNINRLIDRHDRERTVEYLFIGVLASLLVGISQTLGVKPEIANPSIFLFTFWVAIAASIFKWVRFGWIRSALFSVLISISYLAISMTLDKAIFEKLIAFGPLPFLLIIWSGFKGTLSGIVAALLGRGENSSD
jgi:hypothetical protein